jgi:hypothetical protein
MKLPNWGNVGISFHLQELQSESCPDQAPGEEGLPDGKELAIIADESNPAVEETEHGNIEIGKTENGREKARKEDRGVRKLISCSFPFALFKSLQNGDIPNSTNPNPTGAAKKKWRLRQQTAEDGEADGPRNRSTACSML